MNRLKAVREKTGYSLYKLAKESGFSAPYLLDLERGQRSGKPETWQRIADALGCTVGELKDKDELRAT